MDLTPAAARVNAHVGNACVRWQRAQLAAHTRQAAAHTAERRGGITICLPAFFDRLCALWKMHSSDLHWRQVLGQELVGKWGFPAPPSARC